MSRVGGREGGGRGRGRGAVVAAARAGLGEQSHRPAALTIAGVGGGGKGAESCCCWSLQSRLRPVTHSVGAVFIEDRPGRPPEVQGGAEGSGKGDIFKVFNNPCDQGTR